MPLVRNVRPRFGQFDSRRAGHFTGSDVFVGVAELLEDGDTVAVAVQRDCGGDSRATDGAFAGCGVAEAAQRACADRLNLNITPEIRWETDRPAPFWAG